MSHGQHKTQHDHFLDKKKEEFLKKKQQNTPASSQQPAVAPVIAGFANDGSFLARVQAMQKQMSAGGSSSSSTKGPPATLPTVLNSSSASPSQNPKMKMPQKVTIKMEDPQISKVMPPLRKPAIFEEDNEGNSNYSKSFARLTCVTIYLLVNVVFI